MGKGIQETKEVLDAAGDVGALFVKHLRDGFQPSTDLTAIAMEIIGKPDVKAALQRAADNIQEVPAELTDVDLGEGFDLAEISFRNGRKVLTALKG